MYLLVRNTLWIPLSFLGIFLLTIWLRPLLPIDETRYLTVAWEMFLRHDWLAPLTMNGEPYHHKPPLLFWLINTAWLITGPSRWSATIPPVLSGIISIYLTILLATRLFPDNLTIARRAPLVMIGSLLFLFYSSMIMFDVTLTVFVLAALHGLLFFSESGKWRYVVLVALALGCGVLTKGPVAYLYVLFPMLLGPLWHQKNIKLFTWYVGCLVSILLSIIPVLFWLVPVLKQSDNHFAFWLVWEQTAGRITGNFNDAHIRPFYFYLPVAPLLMAPWIFFPQVWGNLKACVQKPQLQKGTIFLLCWLTPVFVSFSLISGKQPHYLVPLIPGLAILIAIALKNTAIKILQRTAMAVWLVFAIGHIVGSQTILKDYDLRPIAAFVQAHPDRNWAFLKKYHGEITFLSCREKSIDILLEIGDVPDWFRQHPDGFMIMRFKNQEDVAAYKEILSIPYRGKNLGIFKMKDAEKEKSQSSNIKSHCPPCYNKDSNNNGLALVLLMRLLKTTPG